MLPRGTVDLLRANVNAFLAQHGGDTCVLMPVLPKRLLALLDTVDALYAEREEANEPPSHVRKMGND